MPQTDYDHAAPRPLKVVDSDGTVHEGGAPFVRDITVMASGERSGASQSSDQTNHQQRGATLFVNATSTSGDGTEDLVVAVQAKDPVSENYVTYSTFGLFDNGATGTKAVQVYPGIQDGNNALDGHEDLALGRTWRVSTSVVQGGTGTVTYTFSVGADLHP